MKLRRPTRTPSTVTRAALGTCAHAQAKTTASRIATARHPCPAQVRATSEPRPLPNSTAVRHSGTAKSKPGRAARHRGAQLVGTEAQIETA